MVVLAGRVPGGGPGGGLLVTLLAAVGIGASMGRGIMAVGAAMMLAAMFFTSVVFTFRDSFAPPDTQTNGASRPRAQIIALNNHLPLSSGRQRTAAVPAEAAIPGLPLLA